MPSHTLRSPFSQLVRFRARCNVWYKSKPRPKPVYITVHICLLPPRPTIFSSHYPALGQCRRPTSEYENRRCENNRLNLLYSVLDIPDSLDIPVRLLLFILHGFLSRFQEKIWQFILGRWERPPSKSHNTMPGGHAAQFKEEYLQFIKWWYTAHRDWYRFYQRASTTRIAILMSLLGTAFGTMQRPCGWDE